MSRGPKWLVVEDNLKLRPPVEGLEELDEAFVVVPAERAREAEAKVTQVEADLKEALKALRLAVDLCEKIAHETTHGSEND